MIKEKSRGAVNLKKKKNTHRDLCKMSYELIQKNSRKSNSGYPSLTKFTPTFLLRMKTDIIIDSWASLNNSVFNLRFRVLPILMYLSHSSIVQHAKTVNPPEPSSDFEPKIALMENICLKKQML